MVRRQGAVCGHLRLSSHGVLNRVVSYIKVSVHVNAITVLFERLPFGVYDFKNWLDNALL